MTANITDLAAWRAAHARPIKDACAWSAAVEQVALGNLRILFAWQRILLRAWT